MINFLYEHLIFTCMVTCIYMLLRSLFAEQGKNNRALSIYLLSLTGFVSASYLSITAKTAGEAFFWFVNIRSFFLYLFFLCTAWLIIVTLKTQGELLSRIALAFVTTGLLVGTAGILFPTWSIRVFDEITFKLHGNIWLRETVKTGSLYNWIVALNISSLLMFFFSRRNWFSKIFIKKNANLNEKQSLLFLVLTSVPQLYGAFLIYINIGQHNQYNLLPAVQTLVGGIAYFFIFNKYFNTRPQSKEWIFKNLPDPVIILSNQNELLDANPAAIAIGHISMEDHLGLPITSISPKNGKQMEERLKNLPATYQVEMNFPDGEKIYESHISQLKSPSGKTTAKILHLHDITQEVKLKKLMQKERDLSIWLETQFGNISLKLEPAPALQQALFILSEMIQFDSAEIYIQRDGGQIKTASLELSASTPNPEDLQIKTPSTLAELHLQNQTALMEEFVLTHQNKSIGTLVLHNDITNTGYTPESMQEITLFTSRLSILLASLLDMEQKQELAKEKERLLFAQDMHDSVTQTLHAAQMIMQVIIKSKYPLPAQVERNLVNLNQQINGALQEMRTMLFEMRPASMSSKSLAEMIQSLMDANRLRTYINLKLNGGAEMREPPMPIKLNIYRIVQEALSNTIRNTHAKNFWVFLGQDDTGAVFVHIDDDGTISDPTAAVRHKRNLELIRERAESLHPLIKIDTSTRDGTHLKIYYLNNAIN